MMKIMSKNVQTIYCGVDNGLSGGIAIIQGRKILELLTMPTVVGSNDRNEYDISAIIKILEKYKKNSVLIIEKAQAMPKLGTVQAFSFGKLYGIMLGLACALKIPHNIIHSKTWQKEMFRDISSENTKQASIIVAKQLYPEQSFLATERSKKMHDGMTDALLLCVYAQRHNL